MTGRAWKLTSVSEGEGSLTKGFSGSVSSSVDSCPMKDISLEGGGVRGGGMAKDHPPDMARRIFFWTVSRPFY